jgi:hypothetical protein
MSVVTKRQLFLCCLATALLAWLLGCNGSHPTTPAAESGPNLLFTTQGTVELKREGWRGYVPVAFGTVIRWGDLIRPSTGQVVTILCADLTLRTVDQESGCPCQPGTLPVLTYGDTHLLAPRCETSDIPYILYPRNTAILDDRPLLRWHDAGALSYTVAIVRGGRTLWQQADVSGTEMRYPADAPTLQPEVDYLLSVTDENTGHHSGEDPARGLGFQLLGEAQQSAAEVQRDAILALPLDDPARQFALAVYYAGQGLRGEALMLLDTLTATIDAPAIYLWRGDLLLAMQLPTEATQAYQSALNTAEALGDVESQAAAHAGLWRATGDEAHFDQAVTLYEALGDTTATAALREEHP